MDNFNADDEDDDGDDFDDFDSEEVEDTERTINGMNQLTITADYGAEDCRLGLEIKHYR